MAELTAESSLLLQLSEDDVPGATLAKPIEKQSILTLKQWLLCQGVKMPNSAKDTVNKKVSEIFIVFFVILCQICR